jgi:hypothetical protein
MPGITENICLNICFIWFFDQVKIVLMGVFCLAILQQDGHVGYIVSCYDVELIYDSHTDTFQER